MPWDVTRVRGSPAAIEDHFTTFAAGVTSVDSWSVEKTGGDYVTVIIQYTA